MQHPKDVKGSDKSLLSIPVGQRYTTILARLDAIEKRLDSIMHGADVRNHRYYKLEEDYNRQLSKCAVTQATIKAIEEKLNGID